MEDLRTRIRHLNFVRNPAEEGVVHQVARFQVRRENDELIEWYLDLLAIGQVEKVIAFFERHDPAVEQFVNGHSLAAKVVDQKDSAITLQLERGLADFRRRVLRHFQLTHRELSACDHRRAVNAYPALINLGRVVLCHSLCTIRNNHVDCGIKDTNQLAIDSERSWNPHCRPERSRNSFRDACLSVTRLAKQKQSSPGVDGRAKLLKQHWVQQQVRKCPLQVFHADRSPDGTLLANAVDVLLQWNRCRAKVGTLARQFVGSLEAFFRDDIGVVASNCFTFERYQLLFSNFVEIGFDEAKRQLDVAGDASSGHGPAGSKQFQKKPGNLVTVDSCLAKFLRWTRHKFFRWRRCRGIQRRNSRIRFRPGRKFRSRMNRRCSHICSCCRNGG